MIKLVIMPYIIMLEYPKNTVNLTFKLNKQGFISTFTTKNIIFDS